jgi:hypothetical protein
MTDSSPRAHDRRAVRSLARSVYRNMQNSGLSHGAVLDLASALIDLVRDDVRVGDRRIPTRT